MSLNTSYSTEVFFAAGKASPPIAVTGLAASGMDLQTWVLIATLVYTVLQASLLIFNFFKGYGKPKDE